MEPSRDDGREVERRVLGPLAELCALDPERDWPAVPDAAIQDLMALAVRLYAARAGGRGDPSDPAPAPYRPESGVTATQVAIAAEHLLGAADIDIFELQMWRMLGAR